MQNTTIELIAVYAQQIDRWVFMCIETMHVCMYVCVFYIYIYIYICVCVHICFCASNKQINTWQQQVVLCVDAHNTPHTYHYMFYAHTKQQHT